MDALARLTQLQHLTLEDVPVVDLEELIDMEDDGDVQAAAYGALRALTNLVSLRLHCEFGQPMPRGALRHMLAGGACWPQLTALEISAGDPLELFCEPPTVCSPHLWTAAAAEVDGLGAACPGLQSLNLTGVLRGEASVARSLARLQTRLKLPKLVIGDCSGWLNDDTAGDLGAMSGALRSLDILCGPGLTDVGLVQLARLTSLERLRVGGCKLSEAVAWEGERDVVTAEDCGQVLLTKGGGGTCWLTGQVEPEDVAGKLMLRLRECSKVLPGLQEQVAKLQARAGALAIDLASSEAEVGELDVLLDQKEVLLEQKDEELAQQAQLLAQKDAQLQEAQERLKQLEERIKQAEQMPAPAQS